MEHKEAKKFKLNHIPFGDEWEKIMMRLPKRELIDLIRHYLIRFKEIYRTNDYSVMPNNTHQRKILIEMLEWGIKENIGQQDLNSEQIVDLYLNGL